MNVGTRVATTPTIENWVTSRTSIALGKIIGVLSGGD